MKISTGDEIEMQLQFADRVLFGSGRAGLLDDDAGGLGFVAQDKFSVGGRNKAREGGQDRAELQPGERIEFPVGARDVPARSGLTERCA